MNSDWLRSAIWPTLVGRPRYPGAPAAPWGYTHAAIMAQVRTLGGFSTIQRGRRGPAQRKKKTGAYRSTCRDLTTSLGSSARTKWAISWSRAASPLALATTHGTGPLGHFMGAVFGNKLAPNRQRRRCPRS